MTEYEILPNEELQKRQSFYYEFVEPIKMLHQSVSSLEHVMREERDEGQMQKEFDPYEPTFFIYTYFTFNTIFSYDWEKSLEACELVEWESGSEIDRIKKLIEFCLRDDDFVEEFLSTFRRIVTARFDEKEIRRAADKINPENIRINNSNKGEFKVNSTRILSLDGFQERLIKALYSYIYAVRCNIVHGTKGMNEMRDSNQRQRIMIYSDYLIALQHMLFMSIKSWAWNREYDCSWSSDFVEKIQSSARHYRQTLLPIIK